MGGQKLLRVTIGDMQMYNSLSDFYRSKEFTDFKRILIGERMRSDGFVYCEHCGKPMVKMGDIIAHHCHIHLTLENVNDANITLNPENIQLVHFRCHNEIHNRFGKWTRHIYLVYGSPLSGKSTYVRDRAGIHDLIIDTDKIYACISNNPLYTKSNRLYDCKEAVESALLDCVKHKRGKWINAFIIGSIPYAFKSQRERFCSEYGAEEIYIDCTKDEALSRLAMVQDGRDVAEWTKYINTFYDRLQA